jgi:hypothetical protein
MSDDGLDPLIHVPTRLKIVATLAALPDGDTLSFTRLQHMLGLTPGLTSQGRTALGAYTEALRDLLGGL